MNKHGRGQGCFLGRRIWVIWVVLCVIAAILPADGHGQQPSRSAAKNPSFGDSPVDAIAARIRADVQQYREANPAAPVTTTNKPEPTPGKESSTASPLKGTAKSKPITSPKVKGVEANAQKCQSAEEALVLFKIFLADADTTADEKAQAQPRIEYWEQAAVDQLVRVGTKWIPKAEADALRKQADALVAEALEMLNVDNFTEANTKLERAGKIYPEHLESVFLLAVGAFISGDFKGAEGKFLKCLQRSPDNVALLNNVGVCDVQMKRYPAAVKNWEKAATIDLENDKIAQNVGQFISDVNLKRIGNVDKRTISDATELYQKMITKDPGNRARTDRGYVLSRLLRPKGSDSSTEENRAVGNGTGFVIAEGFILTNRHVVEDADSLAVQDPSKADALLGAKVVATSKEFDIALIECRGLKAPPLPLNTVPVGRGTEVIAFGFPIATVVGKGLKATRGIVTGLPSADTDKMMVLDAQVNPGNSGGPLCDRTGRVVGVVAAKTYSATFVQGYGLAIPISDAIPFLKQNLREFSSAPTDAKTMEWTDVDTNVSPSTVMVVIRKKR